jgi:hypothetical protein
MDWHTVSEVLAIAFLGYFLSAILGHIKSAQRRWDIEDGRWKARNKREAATNLLIGNGYSLVKVDAGIDGDLTHIFSKEATTAEGRNYYNFFVVEDFQGFFIVRFLGSKSVDRNPSDWECRLEHLFDGDLEMIEAFQHREMSLR